MKRLLEYALVFFAALSVVELCTIILSTILYSYFSYTNAEALLTSRIVMVESFAALSFTLIFVKSTRK